MRLPRDRARSVFTQHLFYNNKMKANSSRKLNEGVYTPLKGSLTATKKVTNSLASSAARTLIVSLSTTIIIILACVDYNFPISSLFNQLIAGLFVFSIAYNISKQPISAVTTNRKRLTAQAIGSTLLLIVRSLATFWSPH